MADPFHQRLFFQFVEQVHHRGAVDGHRGGQLDELEEQSLVERVRHPQDRRAFLIHLTGGGRDTRRRAAAALAGAADTLLTPLDPAEREQLVDLLGKVAAHWQQVRAVQPDPSP